MAEHHNPGRFSGLTPKDNEFGVDDFTDQVPVEGRLGYLRQVNLGARPKQGEKIGKEKGKKNKRI